MSTKQHTLKSPICFSGKGLHTGAEVVMNVTPAPIDYGIVFKRVDVEGAPEIPALCDFVTDTSRGTTIERGGVRVLTIEHILSALWTMGVDNAIIEIDAPETPIMDGSARQYAASILEIGVEEQAKERVYYNLSEKKTFRIEDKGVEITIYPDDCFSASVLVDFNSKVIGNQYATYVPGDDYAAKVASCRTFVFAHELEPLLNANLIKGGDLDNAIVIVEQEMTTEQLDRLKSVFKKDNIEVTGGYINNLELRYPNEIARHKLLDLLGDFALLGMRINGRVCASRPGHYANSQFMSQIRQEMRKGGERPRFKYNVNKAPIYDVNDIRKMLPHRPPFLLVDKVVHVDDNSIVGIKNVTMNEPFFVGHFPEEPVMPGVLMVEAMAQCSGILVLSRVDEPSSYSTYFMKIDNVRFKKKVVPGDTLQFELRFTEPVRRGIAVVEGKAFVGESLVCEAEMMAQIVKNKK
ncbi:MAG: bifunctional UDP-3-O-[3-hydroxymyristoyl] N-acetylglucosamine deacetylase/3-hydroxyacyl-ACP dehydratase [Rikenellaceae bacterium]